VIDDVLVLGVKNTLSSDKKKHLYSCVKNTLSSGKKNKNIEER